MKKIFLLILLCGVISMNMGIAGYAESVNYSWNGTSVSFETGTGSAGDIRLAVDGIYRNGQKISSVNQGDFTLFSALSGGHLQQKNYTGYNISNLYTTLGATYSPVAWNFDGSPNLVSGSGVLELNSLVIDNNVMLTSDKGVGIVVKVKTKTTINGVIQTSSGDGGVGGAGGPAVNNGYSYGGDGGSGQSTSGIIIISDSIFVNETGGVLAGNGGQGGGGGGGGTVYLQTSRGYTYGGNGGAGGNGGNISIYCITLTNTGVIKAGNGGGSGQNGGNGSVEGSWMSNTIGPRNGNAAGPVGKPGITFIYSSNTNIDGWVMNGYAPLAFSPGGYSSSSYFYSGINLGDCAPGGYGSYEWDGGSATQSGSGGTSGQSGDYSTCTIPANALTISALGGTSSLNSDKLAYGSLRIIGGATAFSITSTGVARNIYFNSCENTDIKVAGDIRALGGLNCKDLSLLSGSLRFDNSFCKARDIVNNGTLTDIFNVEARDINNTGDLLVNGYHKLSGSLIHSGSNLMLSNNKENLIKGQFRSSGGLGSNVYTNVIGDTHFTGNMQYKLDTSYWSNRNVYINGMHIFRCAQTSQPNAVGINEVLLSQWFNNGTATYGAIDMQFTIGRKLSQQSTYTFYTPVTITLSANSVWQDPNTKVGIDTYYSVGWRLPSQSGYGFVYIDNFDTIGHSNGGGPDCTPPIINFFMINNESSSTNQSEATISIAVSDDRTDRSSLKMVCDNFVDDTHHYYNYKQGAGWNPGKEIEYSCFDDEMESFPLFEGLNTVKIAITDENGNISYAVAKILFTKITDSSVSPNYDSKSILSLIDVKSSTNLLNLIDYEGGKAYVSNSPSVSITFNRAEFSSNVVSVKYAISGDSYSKSMPLSKTLKLQFPPVCGAYTVKLIFTNKSGIESTDPTEIPIIFDNIPPHVTIQPLDGRTVTKTATIPVVASISDNTSTEVQWSMDKTTWTTIKDGDTFRVPVPVGIGQTTVYFRDQAGNLSSTKLKTCRIN